jgi:hypothetical protein
MTSSHHRRKAIVRARKNPARPVLPPRRHRGDSTPAAARVFLRPASTAAAASSCRGGGALLPKVVGGRFSHRSGPLEAGRCGWGLLPELAASVCRGGSPGAWSALIYGGVLVLGGRGGCGLGRGGSGDPGLTSSAGGGARAVARA